MQAVNEKDPALQARIIDLIQAGVNPEDIAKRLDDDAREKRLFEEEGPPPSEQFPDEILLISQALAYRGATIADADRIVKLLNDAYSDELLGPESFRTSDGTSGVNRSVSSDTVMALLENNSGYNWLLVEAPDGRGVEEDGVILGAACYSTDGVSKKNGEVEGNLGSIRFFGVLRKYRGVVVGQRLLYKVEKAMFKAGCVRSMACVPSSRQSMMDWLIRRGYVNAGGMPYPFIGLGHILREGKEDEQLLRFLKALEDQTAREFAESKDKTSEYMSTVKLRTEQEEDGQKRQLPPTSTDTGVHTNISQKIS